METHSSIFDTHFICVSIFSENHSAVYRISMTECGSEPQAKSMAQGLKVIIFLSSADSKSMSDSQLDQNDYDNLVFATMRNDSSIV